MGDELGLDVFMLALILPCFLALSGYRSQAGVWYKSTYHDDSQMTRQPHDQFAKQYLEELLSPLGKVEVSREVTDEVRQVDILFFPAP
jgi:hypothetical protein